MSDENPYMGPKGLAEYLGDIPVATIYKWNSDGTGPPRIHIGRHVRYRRADVERWLEGQASLATGGAPRQAASVRGRAQRA